MFWSDPVKSGVFCSKLWKPLHCECLLSPPSSFPKPDMATYTTLPGKCSECDISKCPRLSLVVFCGSLVQMQINNSVCQGEYTGDERFDWFISLGKCSHSLISWCIDISNCVSLLTTAVNLVSGEDNNVCNGSFRPWFTVCIMSTLKFKCDLFDPGVL